MTNGITGVAYVDVNPVNWNLSPGTYQVKVKSIMEILKYYLI